MDIIFSFHGSEDFFHLGLAEKETDVEQDKDIELDDYRFAILVKLYLFLGLSIRPQCRYIRV